MSDDLQKLISEAKHLAESAGLDTVAYLLGLAELELSEQGSVETGEKAKPAPHDASRRVRRLPSDR